MHQGITCIFQIEDSRHWRPVTESGIKFATRSKDSIRGMKLFQSENWAPIETIVKYYHGPNHLNLKGFNGVPFTYTIERNGKIRMFHCLNVNASPRPSEPYCAVLVLGCFRNGEENELLGVKTGEPTIEQIDAIKKLWNTLSLILGIKEIYSENAGATLANLVETIRSEEYKETIR